MRNQYYFLLFAFSSLFLLPRHASAQCGAFFDGFETGTLGAVWQFGTGAYTRTVSNTNPAVGTYSVMQSSTASGSFYQGMYATFTPAQPDYLSFWMKTNTTTAANGYVVIGNSNIASDNGILFCYFNSTSQLRFFSSTGYNHNIVANQWYHVEAMDVDWVNRHMDIYVDGVLILTNWPFRSPTAPNMDRVHMFNLSGSNAEYDHIQIGIAGPSVDSVNVLSPLCIGDTNGSIDLSTSSPNGAMSYTWSTGDSTQDISNLVAGGYTVSITDSLGCITTDSITVSDPPAILPAAAVTDNLCPGASGGGIDLTVTGGSPGYTYNWSTGASIEDLSGLLGGTYAVTVTDNNGCTRLDSFSVNSPAAFDPQDSIIGPTCFGGSDGMIDLTPTGGTPGFSYLWSSGDVTEDINGLSAGAYSVLVTDTLGCTYQSSFTVVDPAQVAGNAQVTNLACNGDQSGAIDLVPSGGSPTYTFNWSTGSVTEDLGSLNAGNYLVTITDVNGCSVVETITVSEPAALSVSVTITNATTLPSNGAINITVSGGTPGFTYNWSNGDVTEDITNAPPGNYAVTITDANGCSTTQTYFVDLVQSADPASILQVQAWPNPFQSGFQVSMSGIGAEPVVLQLHDLQGRLLWQHSQSTDGQVPVQISAAAGVYLLQVREGTRLHTYKLVRE